MYYRALSNATDGGLIAAPAAIGLVAQATPAIASGPWAVAGLGLSIIGLWVKLHFQDKQQQRTEGMPLVNAEMARLKGENETLRERVQVIYGRPMPTDHPPGLGRAVLLVEDSDAIGSAVMRVLRGADYRVTRATTVADAIRLFDTEPPDAIACDLKLPDGDGEMMLAHANRSGLPCRLVVLTGSPDEARLARARTMAHVVLTKPVNADLLIEALRPIGSEPDLPTIPMRGPTDRA